MLFAVVALAGFGWLLARLVWLPYYFGLFFFLVAGLIVGAICFRIARSARPISGRSLTLHVAFVCIVSMVATVHWEYLHFAATVGDPPKFRKTRNAAMREGRDTRSLNAAATTQFKLRLDEDHRPGSFLGYARWSIGSGQMQIRMENETENVQNDHRGWTWLFRTLIGGLLMAAGLWSGLEAIRSPFAVSNILAPGEEAEELDD